MNFLFVLPLSCTESKKQLQESELVVSARTGTLSGFNMNAVETTVYTCRRLRWSLSVPAINRGVRWRNTTTLLIRL